MAPLKITVFLSSLRPSSIVDTLDSILPRRPITMCITRHRHRVKSCVYTKDSLSKMRRFNFFTTQSHFFFQFEAQRVNGRREKLERNKSKKKYLKSKRRKKIFYSNPSWQISRESTFISFLLLEISREVEIRKLKFNKKTSLLLAIKIFCKTFRTVFDLISRINLKISDFSEESRETLKFKR